MAKKNVTATTATIEKVKRFQMHARLLGGDGATVRVNLRERKTGGAFNLSTTLKDTGAKKAQTGATSSAPTKEEAVKMFDDLVAVAIAHGWVKKTKPVRVPKAPAFTIETFPTAKPFVGGVDAHGRAKVTPSDVNLLFPKKGATKTTKK
jgi:hypothetical protein